MVYVAPIAGRFAMLMHARYAYNEYSTRVVEYLMLALVAIVAVSILGHVATCLLGGAAWSDYPAMLTAMRPVTSAMLLPLLGWALGGIASWFVGDASEEDLYRCAGNALGQLACLLSLSLAL